MEQKLTDEAYLQLLRKQPEEGMRKIFAAYYAALCKSIYLVIQDGSAAEDIAQEVLMQLWKHKNDLNINTSLWAYLRRSGYNRALNWLRDRKLRTEREQRGNWQFGRQKLPSGQVEAGELQQIIRKAVDALPPRTRMVFVLSRFEGFSQKEIAAELGISVKTVENQMTRALKMLRVSLKEHLPVKKQSKE